MKVTYEYTTHVEFCPAVGQHNILLRCLPAHEPFQRVLQESLQLGEEFWHLENVDGLGNRVVSAGTRADHSCLRYTSRGIVSQTVYCIPDATPHPMYRLPSALTSLPPVAPGAADVPSLPSLPPLRGTTLEVIHLIMHVAHDTLEYCPGSTDCRTPLSDVLLRRKGVCQDFAHLMIALCRSAGYPARYVCGLMEGEGQTHAWVEVHDGQCWYAFDPTNHTAIATGYIKLAHGRDASDCPVSRGIYMGLAAESTHVKVVVSKMK